jgi:hypothetical protein
MNGDADGPSSRRELPSDRARHGAPPDIGGPDLLSTLAQWTAEARVDEAARSRARERWMRQQAIEETHFIGVLADLAERGRPVLVHSTSGRRHRGLITALGVDFVALRTETSTEVLVHSGAVAAVRTQPREGAAMSGRMVDLDMTFRDAIEALAGERSRVLVATAAHDTFAGDLDSVGIDVVTLRIDGDERPMIYVPLDAILDLSVI